VLRPDEALTPAVAGGVRWPRLTGRQSISLLSAPPASPTGRRRLSLLDSYTVSIIHSTRASTAAVLRNAAAQFEAVIVGV